jgi:hypothetical protein
MGNGTQSGWLATKETTISGMISKLSVIFPVVEDFENDGIELYAVPLQSINQAPVRVEVELPEVSDSVPSYVFLRDEAFRDVLSRLQRCHKLCEPLFDDFKQIAGFAVPFFGFSPELDEFLVEFRTEANLVHI